MEITLFAIMAIICVAAFTWHYRKGTRRTERMAFGGILVFPMVILMQLLLQEGLSDALDIIIIFSMMCTWMFRRDRAYKYLNIFDGMWMSGTISLLILAVI